jgi:hypothetical protein
MTTFKTLTLATLTALSLGAGSAMAQSEDPSVSAYLPLTPAYPVHQGPVVHNTVSQFPQSGSADMNTTRPVGPGTAQFPEWKYGDLPG